MLTETVQCKREKHELFSHNCAHVYMYTIIMKIRVEHSPKILAREEKATTTTTTTTTT